MASQSSAKFSEWASRYHLSAELETIDGLVKEGIECQAALAGLKEAELEQLRGNHRLSLGQYSLLRGLCQLCKSKRADEKPSTDVAIESAKNVEGEIARCFPTFYRRKFTEAPVEPTTTKFQPKTTVATSKGKRKSRLQSASNTPPPAKRASYDGGKMFTTVCLPNDSSVVPRGKAREKLRVDGRVKSVLLFKSMNLTDLVKKIHSLFPNAFGESASDSDVPLFEYLAADEWNGLNCVEESLPQKHWDGENIRDLAGCGCIYIRPKVKQEDICPKV